MGERVQVPSRRAAQHRDEDAFAHLRDLSDCRDSERVQLGGGHTADTPESLDRKRMQKDQLAFGRDDEVAVLVNGLGATPKEELYILYRGVARVLAAEGLRVHRVWVGEYATSLEMAGASLTLMRLDDELRRHVDAPAGTPFFVQA